MKLFTSSFQKMFFLSILTIISYLPLSLYALDNESLEGKTRLATMPFENLAGDAEFDFLSEGIADTLSIGLENVSNLIIVERTQIDKIISEQALGLTGMINEETAPKVGKLIGANVLIIGSYQKAGPLIRLDARFVQVAGAEIKKDFIESIRGNYDNLFDLQYQLVTKFLTDFEIGISEIEKERLASLIKATDSLEAYQYYIRGRNAYYLATEEGYLEAIKLYKKAIEIDPKYALAYAGLGETYSLLGWHKKVENRAYQGDFSIGLTYANKAVSLSPDLGEAHRSLVFLYKNMDDPRVLPQIKKALQILPNDAELWYIYWVGEGSKIDSLYIKRALVLNPNLIGARNDLGAAYARAAKWIEAIAEYRKIIEINPRADYAYSNIAEIYIKLKRYNDAIKVLKRAIELNSNLALNYFQLGEAFYGIRQIKEAIKNWEEYLKLDPYGKYANQARELIKEAKR